MTYKTFQDGVVLPAEEIQDYLMDQTVVQVADSTALAALPTAVKAAYVLNTGVLMARDNVNDWYPQGGTATVSETAPSNPQTGAIWVKPSEVLPLPVRTIWSSITGITDTSYASQGRTETFTTSKDVMAIITFSTTCYMTNSATTEYRSRLSWTDGTNSGDSQNDYRVYMFKRVYGSNSDYFNWAGSWTMVLRAGTTTFTLEALRETGGTFNLVNPNISITPIAWADQYSAGVT